LRGFPAKLPRIVRISLDHGQSRQSAAPARRVSKSFAGLAFLRTPPISAGLAQRLLPDYDVDGCDPAKFRLPTREVLRMPERAMPLARFRSVTASSWHPEPRMADDDRKKRQDSSGPGTAVITKTRPQTKRPSMYRVLLLNDDYTPMEFVVHVLERFFNKDREAATQIMLHVHHHGIGECGIYTYEVAETKVTQVMDFARKHHHPLQCVMEKK
jgi:ATP-dependent Clp protease adaptor protein ClpS